MISEFQHNLKSVKWNLYLIILLVFLQALAFSLKIAFVVLVNAFYDLENFYDMRFAPKALMISFARPKIILKKH